MNTLPKGKVIKYFGGKHGPLARWLLDHFPVGHSIYLEPFGGSASMLVLQETPIEIYNDLEGNVHALFKVISNPRLFAEFKVRCDLCPYSAQLRAEFAQELKKPDLGLLDRAFYFFYVNRTSHHGIGSFSTNSAIHRNMAKCVADFLAAVDRLPEFHQRFSKVIIHQMDALKMIQKFDKPHAFMYLDPPYHQSTRSAARYPIDFSDRQQQLLVNYLIRTQAKVLVSGYDCEEYQRLEDHGWIKRQKQLNVVGTNGKPKKKTETIWMNYTCDSLVMEGE